MFMLDTNICIYIKKNNPPQVLAKLQSLPVKQVCMSSITYAELFYGAIKSRQSVKNIEKIFALKSVIPILPFDEPAAVQ
ncbi:MAG: PIN domain-containing protein [Methylobacter sp.]